MHCWFLQWHFSRSWSGYYSRFPWPGYEQAMKQGRVPAFLTDSPRSLRVGFCAIFALPFLTLWRSGRHALISSLALWMGIIVALMGVWLATPQFRQDSNLWPIDLVVLFFCSGLPLMAGAIALITLQKAGGLLKGFLETGINHFNWK